MKSAQVCIANVYGIHCRPSAVIIKACFDYPGAITAITESGGRADAKNMLALLGLGLQRGQPVTLEVDGPEADEMLTKVVALFETDFDFKR